MRIYGTFLREWDVVVVKTVCIDADFGAQGFIQSRILIYMFVGWSALAL